MNQLTSNQKSDLNKLIGITLLYNGSSNRDRFQKELRKLDLSDEEIDFYLEFCRANESGPEITPIQHLINLLIKVNQ